MKKYYLGCIEIKNTEKLREVLNQHEELKLVGIQRSLAHLNEYGNESDLELIFGDYFSYAEKNENIYTSQTMSEFELPLFDGSCYKGNVLLKGQAKYVFEEFKENENEDGYIKDIESYFSIESVEILDIKK